MLGLGSNLYNASVVGGLVFPDQMTGIQLWLRGEDELNFGHISTMTDTAVEGEVHWQDSSGNDNHATQTDFNYFPTIMSSGKFMRFSHSDDDHLSFSTISIPTANGAGAGAYTFCAVVKPASYSGTQNTILSADVNDFFELQSNDQIRLNYDSGTSVLHPDTNNLFTAGSLYAITITRDTNGAHKLYRNTNLLTLTGTGILNLTNTNYGTIDCLGARDKATPDRGFDGDMYEIVWINGDPNDNVSSLHEYIEAKFGASF